MNKAKNPAIQAIYELQDSWDRGGDMGYDDGLVVRSPDGLYAVKIELWNDDCLADLARGGTSAAQRRGQALAKQWSKEKWPNVGYEEIGIDGIYGATWAWDYATEEEINGVDDDEIINVTF